MIRSIIICLLITATCWLNAQNLVPNPGFEDFSQCPYTHSGLIFVISWNSCIEVVDHADYYNACNKDDYSVPLNVLGYQKAHSGNGYVGILCYRKLNNKDMNIREFIQAQLTKPLVKDWVYSVKFYVSRADISKTAIDGMGAYFSDKIIQVKKDNDMMQFKPQITNPKGNILKDTSNWIKISGLFKASGKEKVIVIGNFTDDKYNTVAFEGNKLFDLSKAYYLIDDISVVVHDSIVAKPVIVPKKDTVVVPKADSVFKKANVGQTITLNNIFFETNKSELLSTSFDELLKLVNVLKENKDMEILVMGHTDNTGTEQRNLQLSDDRAKAVTDFLISKGIETKRLTYKGFGSSKPLSSNDTEEGKATNRRVEFIVIKK